MIHWNREGNTRKGNSLPPISASKLMASVAFGITVTALLLLLMVYRDAERERSIHKVQVQELSTELIDTQQKKQDLQGRVREEIDRTDSWRNKWQTENDDHYRLKQEHKSLAEEIAAKKAATQMIAIPISHQTSGETYSKSAYGSGVEQWRGLVAKYSDWDVDLILACMGSESGGDPNAISDTDDHGLMQINGGYAYYGEQIYDPAFNIAIAHEMWLDRGMAPWHGVAC